MRRRWIVAPVLAAVILAGAGGVFVALAHEPGADRAYDTRVPNPALASRQPRVAFDEGHRNIHSARGRFGPFARLIESDGCRVVRRSGPFTRESLKSADILVVVNARGPEADSAQAAFTPAECDAVSEWVRGGGSLLLVADHHPCGESAALLASRFGVEMTGGWTDDEGNARRGSGDPGQLLFARDRGNLADHPITRGRMPTEGVGTVETFTGQSLKGPSGSVPLLLLADTAMDRIPVASERTAHGSQVTTTFKTEDRSAAGRCQGLAMRFGAGRLVVLAEAAMLSAQIDHQTGQPFGMNAPNNDDRAFALNTVRWLAGVLD